MHVHSEYKFFSLDCNPLDLCHLLNMIFNLICVNVLLMISFIIYLMLLICRWTFTLVMVYFAVCQSIQHHIFFLFLLVTKHAFYWLILVFVRIMSTLHALVWRLSHRETKMNCA